MGRILRVLAVFVAANFFFGLILIALSVLGLSFPMLDFVPPCLAAMVAGYHYASHYGEAPSNPVIHSFNIITSVAVIILATVGYFLIRHEIATAEMARFQTNLIIETAVTCFLLRVCFVYGGDKAEQWMAEAA